MTPAIAVTGLGLVTAYGFGVDRFWDGLLTGRSALGPARRFGAADYRGECVGEVPAPPRPGRQAYVEAALAEALADAGYATPPADCLVVVVGQTPAVSGPAQPAAGDLVGPALGGQHFLSHACASAAFGVAFARELMAGGVADVAVVAGASGLNPVEYASLRAVRAVSGTRARPFDVQRDGISLGEGGGAIVLETVRHADERGARTDLLVAGAAGRVAGDSPAASDQDIVGHCVAAAIGEAGVDRVDYVQAHATGTAQGDAAELAALEELATRLGGGRIPVSSHKGAIGHLLHASCFPALAAAALAIRAGILPPTPGLADAVPTDAVRLLRHPEAAPDTRVALVVSAGFGGNNAALLLSGAGSR